MSFLIGGFSAQQYKAYIAPSSKGKQSGIISYWMDCSLAVLINRLAYFILHRFTQYPNNPYLFEKFLSHDFNTVKTQSQYMIINEIFLQFQLCSDLDSARIQQIAIKLKDIEDSLKEGNAVQMENGKVVEEVFQSEEDKIDEVVEEKLETKSGQQDLEAEKEDAKLPQAQNEKDVEQLRITTNLPSHLSSPVKVIVKDSPPSFAKEMINETQTSAANEVVVGNSASFGKESTGETQTSAAKEVVKDSPSSFVKANMDETQTSSTKEVLESNPPPFGKESMDETQTSSTKEVLENNPPPFGKESMDETQTSSVKKNGENTSSSPDKESMDKSQVSVIRKVQKISPEKLETILKDLLKVESDFQENMTFTKHIFETLRGQFPQEKILIDYSTSLQEFLVFFQNFYVKFNFLCQDPGCLLEDRFEKIASLYYSEEYCQALTKLVLLHSEFQTWGGEGQYEQYAKKTNLSSDNKIIQEMSNKYSPIIFVQRLTRIPMQMADLAKQTGNSKIEEYSNKLKDHVKKINEDKREIEFLQVFDRISQILKSNPNAKETSKQAIQLFVENQLDQYQSQHPIKQEIENLFCYLYPEILSDLLKQIEDLKNQPKKNPSDTFSLNKLKKNLESHYEYLKKCSSLSNFEPWEALVKASLKEPLTYETLTSCWQKSVEIQKLDLIQCFVNLIPFIPTNGDKDKKSRRLLIVELMTTVKQKVSSTDDQQKKNKIKKIGKDLKQLKV